jgi:hypothetical protein
MLLNLTVEDWPVLSQIFTDFAIAHSLSLRRDQQTRRGQLMWRTLDLCNEAGVKIEIRDMTWLDGMPRLPAGIKGAKLSIFEFKADSGWKPLARELVDKIRATWPEKIVFRGRGSETLSETEAFKGRQ